MSLIGSVGLSNNQNGLYLGQVNVDNADEFALTANSIYVNDNIKTIQSAVNNVTQADVIYISSGSYGEAVTITNKYNMALIAPSVGSVASTLCEILNGVVIDGTSELVRLNNLQIKGAVSKINGVGRNRCNNIVFTGTLAQTNTIEIGNATTKFLVFTNCEFDNYCNVTVHSTFASVVYFINCNFGSCTLTLSQASPLQVIINNCSGFVTFPVNATYYGINVLASGTANLTTTNINGSTPGTSKVSVTSQADHRIVTGTNTTDVLHCNQTLQWDDTQLSLFNSNPLVIGRGNNNSSSATNTAIGVSALSSITSGTNNTVIGYSNQSLTTNSNNTIVGANNTFNSASNANTVLIGSNSKCGNDSVSIGASSFCGNASVSVGYNSGKTGITGGYNVIIGSTCGNALTSGNGNCLIGSNNSQTMTSGTNNTILGISSGGITSGSNNTICGYYSDVGATTYNNCSVLGSNIRGVVSGSNQVQLGDSSTNTYIYGALQIRSDMRDKTDIQDTKLGLNFINKLRPVDYKYNYREDYVISTIDSEQNVSTQILPNDGSKKRNRFHSGLIAQEVKQAMDELNVDFGGYQDHSINGGEDKLTIGYEELIPVLIKAVQELSNKNKELEDRINNLTTI